MYYNNYRNYPKEERYRLEYNNGKENKYCYPRSKESKEENIAKCKELGYKVISCKKLYPFSTNKNQHNFMLISNICSNTMHDMNMGEIPYDEAEYHRLAELKDKADEYFCYELPVAWVTYEELCEMKEISALAVNHRMDRCIEAGHPEWVQYC